MISPNPIDVFDVAWSSNSDLLASCSFDNTVRIWAIPGFGKHYFVVRVFGVRI